MHLPPDAIGDDFGGIAKQEPEIARVALANTAETNHEDSQYVTPMAASIWLATLARF